MNAQLYKSIVHITLMGFLAGRASALDEDMARFATSKRQQVVKLAGSNKVPSQVLGLFDAVQADDWDTATNLAAQIQKSRYGNTNFSTVPDKLLKTIWPPVQETIGAYKQFHLWDNRLLHQLGSNIIASIPKGSIFMGGTDPGVFIVSALEASEPETQRICVVAQGELLDRWYLQYANDSYASKYRIPTIQNDVVTIQFNKIISDTKQNPDLGLRKPARMLNFTPEWKALASAQYSLVQLVDQLDRNFFYQNPSTEIYYEESVPYEWMYPYLPTNSPSLGTWGVHVLPQDKIMEKLFVQECPTPDWMYPNLSPSGFVMHLAHKKIKILSEDTVQKDRDFWTQFTADMLGKEITSRTPLNIVCELDEKLFHQKAHQDFKGSTPFVESREAQMCFSKFRCAIAGLYVWRMMNADTAAEKERMRDAANLSYKQALALCPTSAETVGCYALFLLDAKRPDEAKLIVQTALGISPEDPLLMEIFSTVHKAL